MPFEPHRSSAAGLPLFAVLVFVGCSGMSFPYETVAPKLEYSGRRSVAVAVRDAREQIAAGRRDPAMVGEALVAGARKSPIVTGDGQPLAALIGKALFAALEAGGFSPSVVECAPGEARDEVVRRALDGKPDYLWVIDVEDWWTARHKATTHTYGLAFAVLDAGGEALVERSYEGEVRWDESGQREGAGADEPEAKEPEPLPAAVAPPADPDAFAPSAKTAVPASGSGDEEKGEEEADAGAADEGPPEPEPVADPVPEALADLLGDLLNRMINDPEVPRKMVRFP